jgi:ferric-dicitrate binding protein FerR (iron transport regulator)
LKKALHHFLQMIPDDVERSIMEWTMVLRAKANMSASAALVLRWCSASQRNEL